MPVMTRSARHGETTISMIDGNNASLKDRGDYSCTQRGGSASSRRAAAHERGEHTKSDYSGALLLQYLGLQYVAPWGKRLV